MALHLIQKQSMMPLMLLSMQEAERFIFRRALILVFLSGLKAILPFIWMLEVYCWLLILLQTESMMMQNQMHLINTRIMATAIGTTA